ncbi:MAG TPA: hypothetical protein DD733_03565 [Clostridiales bacterium]|nr:hypothetical protein [Eubacteriales bacterium]HBR31144.1 hypothetical protein [Clostridiales bacterium]
MEVLRNNNPRILKRRAKEIKKYSILMKIIPAALAVLITVLAVVYIASALYTKFGSYTVRIDKYDSVQYALTLSETPDFPKPTARLNSKATQDITNISIKDLPMDLDSINGEHSGKDYLAYTYYLKNAGQNIVDVEYMLYIANTTLGIEKAVRVRLYVNGESVDYARTKTDGTGPELGTVEFLTESIITRKNIYDFNPDEYVKFTVVIWLEGDDPECVDSIIGGQFKIDMIINILKVDEAE